MKKIFIICLMFMMKLPLQAQLSRRASLGPHLLQVNDSIASLHRLLKPAGVLISQVVKNSSAEEMGIKAHDLLLNINNTSVNTPAELVSKVQTLRGGDHVAIELLRDGQRKFITGSLKPLPYETSPTACCCHP